jgi:hypothetical protein
VSDNINAGGVRLCVGGPFDAQAIEFGEGPAWAFSREDGSFAWYVVDPADEQRAVYAGAAPPQIPGLLFDLSRLRTDEAAGEEIERHQDSAT